MAIGNDSRMAIKEPGKGTITTHIGLYQGSRINGEKGLGLRGEML